MIKKISVILIFGGICFVFVFMGDYGFGPTTQGSYAARINNTVISRIDHNVAVNNTVNYYSRLFGDQLPITAEMRRRIETDTLDRMIAQEIVSQVAQEEHLLIVPAFLRDTIVTNFKMGDRFRRSDYDAILRAQRLSPAQFEDKMRRELQMDLARQLFLNHLQPTSLEVQKNWEIQNSKVNIQFVRIDQDNFPLIKNISSSDITSYLEKNVQNLEETYNQDKASYTSELEVKAQHILIKGQNNDKQVKKSTGTTLSALVRVQDIAKKAKTEDFSKLASEFSEDPGSKNDGGHLGYMKKGQMVPAFEEAAFNLKVGQMSEPIQTSFGYHLIKVLDRKEAQTQSFDEVKVELVKKALSEERKEEVISNLRSALEKGDEKVLEDNLKSLDTKWEETGLYALDNQAVPKMGNSPQVTKAAMSLFHSPSSLYPQMVSEGKMLYILRLKEKQLPPEKGFDQTEMAASKEAMQKKSAQNAFDQWVLHIRKNALIEVYNQAR